ncbi:chromate efflux transporter [Neorhizobium sp. JUb45]|uniref:chromate efflux transporter n=1 Tax=unclassified Neorhizobium TaxID=2629175 RepID=UPI00104E39EE|nr:chromate efflux transporter [Neorhizobium sp. JUb45]TCR04117.1 chromate transporter [Neorhizobium sp. JUb45]
MAAIDGVEQQGGAGPTLSELTGVFARIGCLSFGGPAGQIGMMHRSLVEEKRWISEERFLHALNYCMLLPGPEAQQLATYIGWLVGGIRGGIIAGLLFILPGLFVMIGLSAAYCLWQETTWLDGLFFGLKAAVLVIVVEAVIRLGRKTLKTGFLRTIAALAFIALFFFGLPFPIVVLVAGIAGVIAVKTGLQPASALASSAEPTAKPRPLRAIASLLLWVAVWQAPLFLLWALHAPESLSAMFSFFSRMALVTFGGAYAVLAYVAQVAVEDYGWLRPGEMVDGLALAETTPGPLVLVLSFVGFLVGFRETSGLGAIAGGALGAVLVAWATFVPSFIFIFAGAPFIERMRGNAVLSAALSAITAAVVGVILNLALWFGLHVLFAEVIKLPVAPSLGLTVSVPVLSSIDLAAVALFLVSALLLFRFKLGVVPVLCFCAVAGLALRLSGLG